MEIKQVIFPEKNRAALITTEIADTLAPHEVLIKTRYCAVSAGTERANLIGELNISGARAACNQIFPREFGYCVTGVIEKIGSEVTKVAVGDNVVLAWGRNKEYNLVPDKSVYRIPEGISLYQAALVVIGTFSCEGVRKTRLEFGESAMVMGLGILGLISVALARIAGATPVIAVDPNPDRRELALTMGADFALDPSKDSFVEDVKALTDGKGANAVVEVTGRGDALNQALLATARFGRVTLLGCTRQPPVCDFYHDVHWPGIEIIGAHTMARAQLESRPGCWTEEDDVYALLHLIKLGRLDLTKLVNEVHSPADCPEVYNRLAFDYAHFPIGVLFDWDML